TSPVGVPYARPVSPTCEICARITAVGGSAIFRGRAHMSIFGMAWRQWAARLAVVTLGAATLMVVGLYSASSAGADPYPPTQGCGIVAGTANVTAGESVTVIGSGFTADSTIGLTIESSPQSLGRVHTNA